MISWRADVQNEAARKYIVFQPLRASIGIDENVCKWGCGVADVCTLLKGSEDFAYFLQHRPGCFLRVGNGDSAMVHSAAYDFNDENLTVGAAYWTRLVETYLA